MMKFLSYMCALGFFVGAFTFALGGSAWFALAAIISGFSAFEFSRLILPKEK